MFLLWHIVLQALGGVDLLGADRNRGHFDRWLEPFIGFLYETNRQVKDALMVSMGCMIG